jgi:L-ribulose-5-phosphate 3-epimerase
MKRRIFIRQSAALSLGMGFTTWACNTASKQNAENAEKADTLATATATGSPLFKISLAEWSLHNTINAGNMTNLDFPAFARKHGIEAVEYVNQFFMDKAKDQAYLTELKNTCQNEGITSVLIMCDNEGELGDPDEKARMQAVENHYKWADAAKFLGCHSIRVNARSEGSYEEQQKLAAEGLQKLAEYTDTIGINVIVENHGGLSSNGEWLAGVMEMANHPRVGTLPDFGNFCIERSENGCKEEYDRYKGVKEMMPYAKGISAKTHEFDANGNEVHTDYTRMMKIVLDAGYRGYVDIEYEGDGLSEEEGIIATKKLLEKVRSELASQYT